MSRDIVIRFERRNGGLFQGFCCEINRQNKKMKIVKSKKRIVRKTKKENPKYKTQFRQGEIVILHKTRESANLNCNEKSSLLDIKNGRPAVVISNNYLAKNSSKIIVIKLTHTLKPFPSHHIIKLNGDVSAAVCEEPTTVDKSSVSKTHTYVSKEDLVEILHALMWAITPEPIKKRGARKI